MRVQQYDIDNQILEERNTEIKQLEGELQGLNEMFVDIAQVMKNKRVKVEIDDKRARRRYNYH